METDNTSLAFDNLLDFSSSTTTSVGANVSSTSGGASTTLSPEPEEGGMSAVFYVMLTIFAVVGSVGNALAIYVFASLKQKLTSTIFILTLAGTDFLTCVITLPFTMYMETVEYRVGNDFVCKIYFLLSTTTVPFSAVVMVAIAVDRYMCICHPFHHWMTIQRARIIIGILLTFVLFYGIVICMHYSIHWEVNKNVNVTEHVNLSDTTSYLLNQTGYSNINIDGVDVSDANMTAYISSYINGGDNNFNSNNNTITSLMSGKNITRITRTKLIQDTVNNVCSVRWDYIDAKFMKQFRNMYFANFAISCALVLILYSFIYRKNCASSQRSVASCGNARSIETHHESVEITQDIELSNVNGDRYNTRLMSGDEAATAAAENHNNGSTRKCSISKARIERMRVANIKTCFTLFIVNVVFIISFLPAWLMAMNFLDMHVIIFYMHFFYNVCNPLIYAFLNQNFKAELQRILHCGKV